MRIAQVVSTYPPYQGGMGNVAASFHDVLVERGHSCDVYTPHSGQTKPWFRFGNAAFMPSLGRMLRDYDVVHLHYPFFGGAESVAWFLRHRRPEQHLVITYHMDTVGSGLLGAVFAIYRRLVMPFILRQADVITVSSLDYAKNSAIAPLVASGRVKELPFGVADAFKPLDRAVLTDDSVLNLLFVGGLDTAHYFKGLPVLLDALVQGQKAGLPLRLTIIGDGNRRAAYEAQARELGLLNQVQFFGKVPQVDLIAAYQKADLTVLPSIDRSEAFGLVLQESLACGTPVLASDLPGVRTVFEEGVSGWKVKPNDVPAMVAALQKVWDNRARLGEMRAAATKRVNERYRMSVVGERLEQLYTLPRQADNT